MSRALGLGLALLCALAGSTPAAIAAQDIAVRDDAGTTLHLPTPARRIVALAPHLAELVFAAGAGDFLVGTVQYSDYPPAAREVARVGGFSALDLETILALRPDLVLAWQSGNPGQQVVRLKELGLPVFVSEPRRLGDIPDTIERLGRLAATVDRAGENAAAFRRQHRALEARYTRGTPVRVFYQIWDRPLTTVNGQHLISDVIRLCGGQNVFADLAPIAPSVDVEAVLLANPEVIIASGAGADRPEWLDAWRRWPGLAAVQGEHLYAIDPDVIQRHTPRILEGAARLCQALERVRRSGSGN